MSDTLDLKIYGSAGSCRTAATTVRENLRTAKTTWTTLGTQSTSSVEPWEGPSGEQFRSTVTDLRTDLETARLALDEAATALDTFASELDVAKSKMTSARQVAVDAGLQVSGDTITAPTEPGDDAEQDAVDDYNAKVTAWNTAVGHADDGRKKEDEAHTELETGMKAALDVTWLQTVLAKLGIIPEQGSDPIQTTGWGFGLLGTAGGVVASHQVNTKYGIFKPRGPGGQWVSPSSLNRWQTGAKSMSSKNWAARPYQAGTRGSWLTASKWVGRAGGALTFATSAYSQWQKDADDPSLSTAERVGRSGTVGLTAAGGAWGGATLGAAIGTAIFPGAGTVVGGLLGGAIGGIAGSAVGESIAEFGGDVAEGITEGVKDIGEGIKDVGSKLKFW